MAVKKLLFGTLGSVLLFLPIFVFAAGGSGLSLKSIVDTFVSTLVQALIALCVSVAVAAFSFGIMKYIFASRSGDGQKMKEGSSFMLWGGIALFVMVSVWGIITYAQGIFGISTEVKITIPNSSLVAIGSRGSTNTQGSPSISLQSTFLNGGNTSFQDQTMASLALPLGTDPDLSKMVAPTMGVDPTISQWDGGSGSCPSGTAFNEYGVCVPVISGADEIKKIEKIAETAPVNEIPPSLPRPSEEDRNYKKFMYAIVDGKLGPLIQNTTGSKDESLNKTIWDMFVKTNSPEVVKKVSIFEAWPVKAPYHPNGVMAYVSVDDVKKGTWRFGYVADAITKNGVLDTAAAYHVVLHEGAHILTLAPPDPSVAFVNGGCPTYFAYYKKSGHCLAKDSYLDQFKAKYWVGLGEDGAYKSAYLTENSFVTGYANSSPSEDIAETYFSFILQNKPTGETIADKKVLFLYSLPELVSLRSSIRQAISAEANTRGLDSDKDGLVDTVEKHRGTDPYDSDSDNDGVIDYVDVDADGDNHKDTQEGDSDNDGSADWADNDDDGDGLLDSADSDDNGDGVMDFQ